MYIPKLQDTNNILAKYFLPQDYTEAEKCFYRNVKNVLFILKHLLNIMRVILLTNNSTY